MAPRVQDDSLVPLHLRGTLDSLRHNVWLVPSACVAGSVALSYLANAIDTVFEQRSAWYLFGGGPDGAREILSAVAASMMTFTGVVFSVTILVLQLASNQFSPRVLRTFLRDLPNKLTLGVFVGTFVYALLGLRYVRGESGDMSSRVPALTVWLAVVLAIVCVGLFVFFIHHVAQSIRAVNVLHRIGAETRANVRRLYPDGIGNDTCDEASHGPVGEPCLTVVHDGESDVLMSVDEDRLWQLIENSDAVVALVPMVGDFVRLRAPIFEIWGDAASIDPRELEETLRFGPERSLYQDAAFGFRQLVDVAQRALSPGINDPTTAVQAIDQIHDLLARLVVQRFPRCSRFDDEGRLRLVLRRPAWSDYVHLAVDEIRRAGESSVQIHRRLRFMLEDLLTVAPTFRRPPLEQQLSLLDASRPRVFSDALDEGVASQASPQGHGAAPKLAWPSHGQ